MGLGSSSGGGGLICDGFGIDVEADDKEVDEDADADDDAEGGRNTLGRGKLSADAAVAASNEGATGSAASGAVGVS